MKKHKIGIALAAWVSLGGICVETIQAQPPSGGSGGDQRSRQQRIQEHNNRIRQIIEESNRRRAAQNPPGADAAGTNAAQQPPAAPGQAVPQPGQPAPTGGVTPGQPLPTGPVRNVRMTPAVTQATPTPPPQAPQTARSESRMILMFHPIDSIVPIGERFQTEVVAETKDGEIDEISFLIKYPRHILNPLALNHAQLDPYVEGEIEYDFKPNEGLIYLHAHLKEPRKFIRKPIAAIIWEAIETTDGAVISYEFGEDRTTGLYLKTSNLLGTLPGAQDGVIRTTVQVVGPKTRATVRKLPDNGFLIGSESINPRPHLVNEPMELQLRAEKTNVKAGEIFDVHVNLDNPEEQLIDRIRLYLQFDPEKVQVVDHDAGNVIKRGINIHDGGFYKDFPFDFYRYNSVDNENGIINYEVSASNSTVRGNGQLATIRLKALQEVDRTELVLVQNAAGMKPTTDVTFLSRTRLAIEPDETAMPLDGVAFRVAGHATQEEIEAASDKVKVYNPFASELAQRMNNRSKQKDTP